MRTVGEAMTRQVLTVHPNTPFKEIAQILVGQGIDAVPVVDETGTLLGVVSGSDLTCHEEPAPSIGSLLVHGRTERVHARKRRGRTARELMSSPACTVSPSVGVCEATATMHRRHVGRLVVVDQGHVVGILTRSDVLRVFTRSDAALQDDVETVLRAALGREGEEVRVTVADGVVHLRGHVERTSTACVAASQARAVPGVVDVDDELVRESDDVTSPIAYTGLRAPRRGCERTPSSASRRSAVLTPPPRTAGRRRPRSPGPGCRARWR
jgi:CBS domain-containing protein